MKLRYISLWTENPSNSGYDGILADSLDYYARFIANYLSKAVRKIDIEIDNKNAISVMLSQRGYNVEDFEHIRSVILYCPEDKLKYVVALSNETERYEAFWNTGRRTDLSTVTTSRTVPLRWLSE